MNGRFEHDLKIKKQIQNVLNDAPNYLTDYYYSLSNGSEMTTCYQYVSSIRKYLSFIKDDINKISTNTVSRYLDSLQYTSKGGEMRNTSFSYQKANWTILNSFFDYLLFEGQIEKNPMKNIKRPNRKDNIQREFLKEDDLKSILNATKTGVGNSYAKGKQKKWRERDYCVIYLLMTTGMRREALAEINVEDLDYKNNKVVVIDKRGKTQEYVLTNKMKDAINQWLIKRKKMVGENTNALFINKNYDRLSADAIKELVAKYSFWSIGKTITPHKLRAAFITLFYKASGNDIKAACVAAGHESIATTSIYIREENNSRDNAVNYMSNLL